MFNPDQYIYDPFYKGDLVQVSKRIITRMSDVSVSKADFIAILRNEDLGEVCLRVLLDYKYSMGAATLVGLSVSPMRAPMDEVYFQLNAAGEIVPSVGEQRGGILYHQAEYNPSGRDIYITTLTICEFAQHFNKYLKLSVPGDFESRDVEWFDFARFDAEHGPEAIKEPDMACLEDLAGEWDLV